MAAANPAPRPRHDRATRSYLIAGQAIAAPALAPGLYLVATPIGNLRDVTLRALEILAAADLIACEDTRVTRKLLDHYGIATSLTPYHDHNAATARPRLLAQLAQARRVALVSDAGTPLVSDPGYKLVREAHAAGVMVTTAPGASAVLAALAVAGLPSDRKRREHRRGAGGCRHHDTGRVRFAHQLVAGVGDERRSGIRDKGDAPGLRQLCQQARPRRRGVVVV